jgi:hypothetical protein
VDGTRSVTLDVEGHPGVNRVMWDLHWAPTPEQVAQFERQMEQVRAQFGGDLPGFFADREPEGDAAGVGSYRVRVTAGGATSEGILRVRDDPGVQGVLPSVR